MASSNATPPVFGGGDAAGTPSAAPAPTPAAATPAAEPQGPNSAGLNPGPVTTAAVPAPGAGYGVPAFQAIANQNVIDGSNAGVVAAVPAKPYDEKQLVASLASTLDVKASKGEPLEVAVVNELADKYGVSIAQSGETTAGTGTGQGSVGQLRHNIASWFESAASFVSHGGMVAVARNEKKANVTQEQISSMKSTRLRDLAQAKFNREQAAGNNQGAPPGQAQPVPEESSKALTEILSQVASKLGVAGAGPNALENIAKAAGAATQTPPTPASAGTPQTYAQNFVSFVAQWNKNEKLSNGQTFQDQWVDNLENMGELNAQANTANFGASQTTVSGGVSTTTAAAQAKPTQDQVFNAYQNFLVNAQQANQSPLQYMQAAPTSAATQALKAGPASEMYAYVQGVAQEMGAGLTQQQLNQISNFYGASATTADDPSSVEDQIKDAVVALYSPPSDPTNPNSPNAYGVVNPAGVANTMYVDIQQQALAYQIPISAGQITSMVTSDLQGATVESMYVAADAAEAKATQTFQDQAKGLYPSLSAQISAGSTVQQLTSPYFNVAEAITGVPASTMMADQQSGGLSKWAAFLQGGNNPSGSTQLANTTGAAAKNQPQMMTIDQWKTYLMQNPQYGFQNTQGAKDMAEQMSSAILNEFGKVNTTPSATPIPSLYQGQSDLSANTS